MNPSKELLRAVLGEGEIKEVNSIGMSAEGNYLLFQYDDSVDSINIHELAHKCKEWAKEEGITNFQSQLGDVGASSRFMNGFDFHDFEADSEPEAIFKACQWISENT